MYVYIYKSKSNFAHVFYLVMCTKRCVGFFLYCLDLGLLIKV